MVVRTDTEQVKKIREANLGFILINHPLDCPICDKGGECPLQDQTMEYGPGVSQFVEVKREKQKHYPISDLIMLDQERCILCWRCIRYLEEWEDKPQLGLFERGGDTVIDTFPGLQVDAKTSGNICDICPVGALTNRVSRFRYRPWEIKKTPSRLHALPGRLQRAVGRACARAAPHRGPREHGGERRVDLRQGPLPASVCRSSRPAQDAAGARGRGTPARDLG